ncbi:MAG TPA: TonB family protein [Candidatus Angelobacter sp.]|jgi:TonB family protein|nr:TonB family protein [Candidatus Angelobacter sp.]
MATQASDTANSPASKKARGASPDDLAIVAQRAQAFTNASGVAIALSEGNASEIVCRARSGGSAPDVGATLRVEGTFTGLCIQTGKELRCDDCETDTRVDTAAIRALGIRSMVVTPIREDSRVVGVLAAFAPTPHAFTITHVAVLKTMADQISALLQRERRAREEGPRSEEPRPAPPAITAKPVIASAPVPAHAAPPAVVIKPSTSAPRAAAPAVAKVEPIKSMPLEVVPLATPPTKKEEKRADVAPKASFGTFDAMALEDKKPGNRFMMIGVVAVLVIAAGATFAFLKMQKPGAKAPQQTQEASNVPAAIPPSGNAQPGSPNANAQPATVAPINTKPVADTETKKSAAKPVFEKNPAPAEKSSPAEKTTAVATLNASGTSRIAQDTSAQPVPEIAPSFNVGGSSSAPLSSLARPVASSTPTAAAIEQSQLEPLQLIKTAQLVYPPIAKARNITGMVVVEVKVGKNGKVSSPRFISGPPVFRDAAFDAVSRYQFKPAKLNGQPIEQLTQIRLNFH